ncbi:uncharacterized protein LOC129268879 [Lytechinus pictus]|uniref:uncharacterized protein LOC129268879 n=1 Tax=Lytechinus pictus TaxID=7653 RepID=UPI0030BA0977
MCEKCVAGHHEMAFLFEGHEIVPIEVGKGEEKGCKNADNPRPDLSSISGSDPKMEVIRCVKLRGWAWGMTRYLGERVAIGYGWHAMKIDIIDSTGRMQQYQNIRSDKYSDLVFLQDKSLCLATDESDNASNNEVNIYSPNGSKKSTIQVRDEVGSFRLTRGPSDEIVITQLAADRVYIYDPTGSILKRFQAIHRIGQAIVTRSGLIVTSSCFAHPNEVRVYDRHGNAGKSINAPEGVYLGMYAAVDEQDRVYVASIDRENGEVGIRLYDLDVNNLDLVERIVFPTLHLAMTSNLSSFVCLSHDMLALACGWNLYFISASCISDS